MRILFVVMFLFIATVLWSQDLKEIFTSSNVKIEFVGLDFSQARMVGFDGRKASHEIQTYYFDAWNSLLAKETEKYDIKRAFMKRNINYDLDIVKAVNQNANLVNILTNRAPKAFSKEQIQTIVNGYDTRRMNAQYGLSFIVHSFNQFQERGYVYIVIFDTKSKNVLFSERMSGEAGGFGFRNYWARTIYNILEDIRDYKFRGWKKQLIR